MRCMWRYTVYSNDCGSLLAQAIQLYLYMPAYRIEEWCLEIQWF